MATKRNQNVDINILVVDDEQTNLLIMKEALSGLGRIIATTDPLEALELSVVYQPQITLLDIEMPKLNGLELCKRLLDNPVTSNTSVMFITSHNETEMEYRSLEFGAVDYITKPIDIRLCRLRVSNHLQLRLKSEALSIARGDLQDLLIQLPIFVSYWSPNWERRFCNDYSRNWFGLVTEKELVNNANIDMLIPEELANLIKDKIALTAVDKSTSFRFELNTYVTGTKFLEIHVKRRLNRDKLIGYIVTAVDLTKVVMTQNALLEEKEWLNVTLNSIGDAVIATDTKADITFMNPIAENMTGWSSSEAKGKSIKNVMTLHDAKTNVIQSNPIFSALEQQKTVRAMLDCKLSSRDGRKFHVENSATPIRNADGTLGGAIIVFHDISEAIAMTLKMSHLATHDQLTGLPNRVLLHERLNSALQVAKRKNRRLAMLMIDIDNFKYVNDTQGHHIGDRLIQELAIRLVDHCSPDFIVARPGGDEFIVIATNVEKLTSLDSLASTLQLAINEPFYIDDKEHKISSSIGISVYPDDANNEDKLQRYADTAMYRAKKQGKNQHCFFGQDLELEFLHRHKIEFHLRKALETNSLEVVFQPQYSLKKQTIVGCEALARLHNCDNNEAISPIDFIPIAEETGLINQLGLQMLIKSCEVGKKLLDGGTPTRMSVNVAAKQFANPHFPTQIKNALTQTQLPSHLLQLEVTESTLMSGYEATKETLLRIKELGVSISIDDFGTGYSSLSYLKSFPIDEIKIDRTFVRDMEKNDLSYNIVKTIVCLAKSLELAIVAEGIETKHEERLLIDLGCDLGQGFMFSKPLSESNLVTALQSHNKVNV
ncbi:TPA: EAL domain-containing protein [Vibrio vulnificus]|nr:EAL domain-containing protein [Vibrio vulnificus]ELC9716444.1 EAL domain-containing protein [Vibrio vulnificus]ELS0761949.1 EAL domain-containing protein [Vibrio vulnificus]ELV8608277.1 EAL domain-containing protein [Vibrio vulnificus]ELV8616296.1 EAL domain-containing protein [Vibrio vulnificus]